MTPTHNFCFILFHYIKCPASCHRQLQAFYEFLYMSWPEHTSLLSTNFIKDDISPLPHFSSMSLVTVYGKQLYILICIVRNAKQYYGHWNYCDRRSTEVSCWHILPTVGIFNWPSCKIIVCIAVLPQPMSILYMASPFF
jgi:hypothetical protein